MVTKSYIFERRAGVLYGTRMRHVPVSGVCACCHLILCIHRGENGRMQTPWMTPNDPVPVVRGRILGHGIALGINGAAGGGSSGFKVFGYLVLPTEKRPKASASGRAQGRQKYGREGAPCATRTAP